MDQAHHCVQYRLCDDVAVLTIDNPPVNSVSHAVRLGLVAGFLRARSDPAVRGIVLAGAGRGFSAGGDIRELGTPAATAKPALSLDVHPVIESSPKPTVAALHGFAVGGGLETAMVCHFRIAAADTRVALPEVERGLIPLSGTQRLPRAVGLDAALDLILSSRLAFAREFAGERLFDAVIEGGPQQIVEEAVQCARRAADRLAADPGHPLPLIRNWAIRSDDASAVLARARESAAVIGGAAPAAVEAIAAAVEAGDFDAGLARAEHL